MTSVAVTMSVFNGQGTVGQALASVAAQTRRPEVVVVVDDGSTDDTVAHLEAWTRILPLTIARHNENRGLAAGRLSGISRVDTDTVLAIDADDFWLPDHLSRLVEAYESRGGVVSPMAVAWDSTPGYTVNWGSRLQQVPKREDLHHLVLMNWLFSGALFSRRAFDAAGSFYRFAGCDDWDLWLRLARGGEPLSVLREPTVLYRVHSGSLSADDRLLPVEVEVLETFINETRDRSLRAIARRSLRHRHARLALRSSYEAARNGHMLVARRAALKSLGGPRTVLARGVGMLVAPAATVRLRDRQSRPPDAEV